MLSADQIQQYERDGFLVLRAQFDSAEIERFEHAYRRQPMDSSIPAGLTSSGVDLLPRTRTRAESSRIAGRRAPLEELPTENSGRFGSR